MICLTTNTFAAILVLSTRYRIAIAYAACRTTYHPPHHPHYRALDTAAFAAKNLYNAANYLVRQSFINDEGYLNYYDVHAQIKAHEAYRALPRKVSQQVLRMLHQNWQAFFAAMQAYRADSSRFHKRPGLPRYLHKTEGRYALVYTIQALSKPALARGAIVPSGLAIEVKTRQTRIAQVRIVPKGQFYVVEVVYEKDIEPAAVDSALAAGIDIGLNTLAAITSNKPGFVPVLVNGRPAKYINQGYNKRRAELQAKLGQPGRSKRMERLTTKRTRCSALARQTFPKAGPEVASILNTWLGDGAPSCESLMVTLRELRGQLSRSRRHSTRTDHRSGSSDDRAGA